MMGGEGRHVQRFTAGKRELTKKALPYARGEKGGGGGGGLEMFKPPHPNINSERKPYVYGTVSVGVDIPPGLPT
jgi:hypothetical protein